MRIRDYSHLSRLETFKERFEYLKLGGNVGEATFGFDRYLNQKFYMSVEWRRAREMVIIRDSACDLGVPGRDIYDSLLVHHMNPVVVDDIISHAEWILDPEFLITTTQLTHNAIHFGDASLLSQPFVERRQGDTKLW